MYRRIELITEFPATDNRNFEAYKLGIIGLQTMEVAEAWMDMKAPKRGFRSGAKFFFTEAGWNKFGRAIVKAAIGSGQKYRIVSFKHNDLEVFYKDEIQVVALPRKKKR